MKLLSLLLCLVAVAAAQNQNSPFPAPKELWSRTHNQGSSIESAATADGLFYYTTNEQIVVMDALTGTSPYNISVYGISQLAAGTGGWLFFVSGNQTFGYQNGKKVWMTEAHRSFDNSAAVLRTNADARENSQITPTVLAVTFNDAHVDVFNVSNGKILMRYDANHVQQQVPIASVLNEDGSMLFVANPGGRIAAFDVSTGSGVWTKTLNSVYCAMAMSDHSKRLWILTGSMSSDSVFDVVALNASDGSKLHTFHGGNPNNDYNTNAYHLAVSPTTNTVIASTGHHMHAYNTEEYYYQKWVQAVENKHHPRFAHKHIIYPSGGFLNSVELESGASSWSVGYGGQQDYYNINSGNIVMAVLSNGDYVASTTSADQNQFLAWRTAWVMPRGGIITLTHCSNNRCTSDCKTSNISTGCVKKDGNPLHLPVSTLTSWVRFECFFNPTGGLGLYYKTYTGTACGATRGTNNYETEQYPNECVISQFFNSSKLINCVEASASTEEMEEGFLRLH